MHQDQIVATDRPGAGAGVGPLCQGGVRARHAPGESVGPLDSFESRAGRGERGTKVDRRLRLQHAGADLLRTGPEGPRRDPAGRPDSCHLPRRLRGTKLLEDSLGGLQPAWREHPGQE